MKIFHPVKVPKHWRKQNLELFNILVDDNDAEIVKAYEEDLYLDESGVVRYWELGKKNKGSSFRCGKQLCRRILDLPKGYTRRMKYKNYDTLDLRRENLTIEEFWLLRALREMPHSSSTETQKQELSHSSALPPS